MLGPLGMPELVVIFVIALIVFGPRKLPELGKSLGKSLAEFKRASNELRNSLEDEIRLEDDKDRVAKATTAPVVPAPVVAPTVTQAEKDKRRQQHVIARQERGKAGLENANSSAAAQSRHG